MENKKLMNILGISATVISISATLLANWVGDKKMDNIISEKVAEAVANLYREES